VEQTIYEL